MAKKETKIQESKSFKVISPFKDKNTQEVYNIGDTFEADAKRAKELEGFIDEPGE